MQSFRKSLFIDEDRVFDPPLTDREVSIRLNDDRRGGGDRFVYAFEIDNRLVEETNLLFARHVPQVLDASLFVPHEAEKLVYPITDSYPAVCWVTPIFCLCAFAVLFSSEYANNKND